MEYNLKTADFADYADFMNRELGESGEFLNASFDKPLQQAQGAQGTAHELIRADARKEIYS